MKSVLVTICILAAAAAAWAEPAIVVGSHTLLPNTPGQLVPILVGGGGQVQDMNLIAELGGGGPEIAAYGFPAGTDGPAITGVSLAGSIWDGHAATGFAIPQDPALPQFYEYGLNLDGDTDYAIASGTLVKLVVDTTGFTGGTWSLKLGETVTGYSTDFGEIVASSITNGQITVTPEPASLSLLALGALAMLKRRRR